MMGTVFASERSSERIAAVFVAVHHRHPISIRMAANSPSSRISGMSRLLLRRLWRRKHPSRIFEAAFSLFRGSFRYLRTEEFFADKRDVRKNFFIRRSVVRNFINGYEYSEFSSPFLVCTLMFPFNASTNRRTIESPRPEPFWFFVGVFLREWFKHFRNEIFIHSDTIVAYNRFAITFCPEAGLQCQCQMTRCRFPA